MAEVLRYCRNHSCTRQSAVERYLLLNIQQVRVLVNAATNVRRTKQRIVEIIYQSMKRSREIDRKLIARIRSGDADAWTDLIARYEGRLLAFVESRLSNRSASEDIVQEAFVGFLNSLPNFDGRRSLESYLFSICAYKLTDHLRREGRRPAIPMSAGGDSDGQWQFMGSDRPASSIARSGERRQIEETVLAEALEQQVDRWQEKGDWDKLKCIELLVCQGTANKDAATQLGLTEQQVANFKFDFLNRLRSKIRQHVSRDGS